MIKTIVFCLIFILINIEAKESICSDKEDNGYSKEELQAYYIREEKIKPLKKKCKHGDKESCTLLAMENIYNFHPCYSDSEKLREKAIKSLKYLCDKDGYGEACFVLGYLDVDIDADQKEYLSKACKQNKIYCSTESKKIVNQLNLFDESVEASIGKLDNYKKFKSILKGYDKACKIEKNGLACSSLRFLYENKRTFTFQVNEYVAYNLEKANNYRYYACLYRPNGYASCHADYDRDYNPPKKWLIKRAKKLKFSIPKPKFIDIKKPTKEIK